ncbi:MAG: nucleotidyl transferase AbiEii/AbiGii toxin family protein [Bacteroidales bacterium]|nr:nucleotidyl transferase AbiEii/AbiGii toxin family protein [Bacteroidales bacterium]
MSKTTMKSYNKNDIAQLAAQTNFLRDNLEKVLRLSDVLQFIAHSPRLKDCLVLKGGTAINLTVFNIPRLSVDIDLDFHKDCTREEMLQYRAEINAEILAYMESQGYQLNPNTKNPHSLDSWVFFYQNAGGNRDNIKIEINYSMRRHIFAPQSRHINVSFLKATEMLTLEPMELFGTKIKALIERHTCRDLYDVYNLLRSDLMQHFDLSLLRKIVVFYLAVGGNQAPSKEYNFETIRRINFSQIRATLLPMLKKGDGFDFETAKTEVVQFLSNLLQFTEAEIAFIDAFLSKKYQPEVMFSDQTIIDNIRNHPMAFWKTKE